jgi:hypothetical protein
MIRTVLFLTGHKVELFGVTALLVLLACAPKGYVKYRPVDADMYRSGYIFSKSPMSAQHRENIKFVFDYYGIQYLERDSQTIFIPSSVMQDTNYVYNCTMKADSPTWIAYKKKELQGDPSSNKNKGIIRTKPLIVAHSTKGQLTDAYFTDIAGNRIRFADTNQTVFFNVLTNKMIGDSVDVFLNSDDFLFECTEYPLKDSLTLKNLKITSDTMQIKLKALDKK